MAKFIITETQIIKFWGEYEAESEEAAREMFMNGEAPLKESSDVTDSYGLTVTAV